MKRLRYALTGLGLVSIFVMATLHERSPLRATLRFFFQAEDGIRDLTVTGVQTCALPIWRGARTLVLDAWRIGDSRAASYSLTRSIRSDYLDPLYARLAYEARKLWLDFQAEDRKSVV